MKTEVERCPSCHSTELRDHCDSRTCPWLRCARCRHYGHKTKKFAWKPINRNENP